MIHFKNKVMMAVDPFAARLRPNGLSSQELGSWLEKHSASLDLVYVVPNPSFDKSFDSHRLSKQLLKDYARWLGVSRVKVKLIHPKGSSKQDRVAALLNYVDSQDVDFLVLTSSGRNWVGRLVQGSFSDSVISGCTVPVMMLGSEVRPGGEVWNPKAMYASDFSLDAYRGYLTFLQQFRNVIDELTVFYASVPQLDYSAVGMLTAPRQYVEEQLEFAHSEGERWAEIGRANGFQTDFVLDTSSLDVATSIKKFAKNTNMGMVGLASVNTGNRARVIDSISSRLFYLRSFPVWVYGPNVMDQDERVVSSGRFEVSLESGRPIL